MGRRYRRRSIESSIAGDTAYVANRLSWQGSLIFGAILFAIFYWALPAWISYQVGNMQSTILRPALEALFAHRIHWSQWLGTALALICAFLALRNYLDQGPLRAESERDVSWFSRLLARWLD